METVEQKTRSQRVHENWLENGCAVTLGKNGECVAVPLDVEFGFKAPTKDLIKKAPQLGRFYAKKDAEERQRNADRQQMTAASRSPGLLSRIGRALGLGE